MRFSEELREAAGPQWDRVVNHKFTNELAAGTIDRKVLKRYLIEDHKFLDSFVILLSSIVAKARCLSDRIPACQFLAVVTGKENTYFERSFEKLKVSDEERNNTPDEQCTTDFCQLMEESANSGSLAEMLAVILVCEWSYFSWASRVEKTTNRDDFVTYEWVDLHSGEEFSGIVDYFRNLLDKEGDLLKDDEKSREACKSNFLKAVQCEEDFFDFAYTKE